VPLPCANSNKHERISVRVDYITRKKPYLNYKLELQFPEVCRIVRVAMGSVIDIGIATIQKSLWDYASTYENDVRSLIFIQL